MLSDYKEFKYLSDKKEIKMNGRFDESMRKKISIFQYQKDEKYDETIFDKINQSKFMIIDIF